MPNRHVSGRAYLPGLLVAALGFWAVRSLLRSAPVPVPLVAATAAGTARIAPGGVAPALHVDQDRPLVQELRSRFRVPSVFVPSIGDAPDESRPFLPAGEVEALVPGTAGRWQPVLAGKNAEHMEVAGSGSEPFVLHSLSASLSLQVLLEGASSVRPSLSDGLVVFRDILPGASLLQQVTDVGAEDFLFFSRRPGMRFSATAWISPPPSRFRSVWWLILSRCWMRRGLRVCACLPRCFSTVGARSTRSRSRSRTARSTPAPCRRGTGPWST